MEDFYQHALSFSFGNYCSSNSIEYALACILVLATFCFILTKLTSDFSWVDRLWPILPIIVGIHYLYHQQKCSNVPISTRQIVMISVTIIWGLRLQYNFFRKGGFTSDGEDYRWKYIRQHFHWVLVELLNFFFTAYYQLILLLWYSYRYYSHCPLGSMLCG